MTSSCDALVVGAGGFLGTHLVRSLLLQGLDVRAVDAKPLDRWTRCHADADNRRMDVSGVEAALAAVSGATTVYDLAAGPRTGSPADRMSAVLLDTHLLVAARDTGVERFVLASSTDVTAAMAATPADNRCWRHLFAERMARHFAEDFGVPSRIARLGPVYGAHAPATDDAAVVTVVTRRVATAVLTHRRKVEIPYAADDPAPGIYVDDAVLGLQLVTHGVDDARPYEVVDPQPRTVAAVTTAILAAAGADLEVDYTGATAAAAPAGDPRPLLGAVDWQPDIPLASVAPAVYTWTADDVRSRLTPPTDLSERWARRRALPLPRAHARGTGRHRYQNAG